MPCFVEDHHGDAGDGLGHGVVAEDGVLGHGRAGGEVAHAIGAVVHDLAVAGEDGDGAGELLLVDFVLHEGVEVFEALGGEADRLGRDRRHVETRGRSAWAAKGGRASARSAAATRRGRIPLKSGRSSLGSFRALDWRGLLCGTLYIKLWVARRNA